MFFPRKGFLPPPEKTDHVPRPFTSAGTSMIPFLLRIPPFSIVSSFAGPFSFSVKLGFQREAVFFFPPEPPHPPIPLSVPPLSVSVGRPPQSKGTLSSLFKHFFRGRNRQRTPLSQGPSFLRRRIFWEGLYLLAEAGAFFPFLASGSSPPKVIAFPPSGAHEFPFLATGKIFSPSSNVHTVFFAPADLCFFLSGPFFLTIPLVPLRRGFN